MNFNSLSPICPKETRHIFQTLHKEKDADFIGSVVLRATSRYCHSSFVHDNIHDARREWKTERDDHSSAFLGHVFLISSESGITTGIFIFRGVNLLTVPRLNTGGHAFSLRGVSLPPASLPKADVPAALQDRAFDAEPSGL
jgi:hypothetical protein